MQRLLLVRLVPTAQSMIGYFVLCIRSILSVALLLLCFHTRWRWRRRVDKCPCTDQHYKSPASLMRRRGSAVFLPVPYKETKKIEKTLREKRHSSAPSWCSLYTCHFRHSGVQSGVMESLSSYVKPISCVTYPLFITYLILFLAILQILGCSLCIYILALEPHP
jgi:hypothetical protein